MRQFQCVPATYVTEIKVTYFEIYLTRIMSISFAYLKRFNLPIRIKIPVTIWQIGCIYMAAISPNYAFAKLVQFVVHFFNADWLLGS